MLKTSQNILQQVNKNCFTLSLVPNATIGGGDLYLFGNAVGTVEANVDLLAYYTANINPLAGARNWLEALELRFAAGSILPIVTQTGRRQNSSAFFSRFMQNRKATVVKTVLSGQMFGLSDSADPITSSFIGFGSYPVDVWKSNGIGNFLKTMTLNLIRSENNNDIAIPLNSLRNGFLVSDLVYDWDVNTIIAVPAIAGAIPVIPPLPPAILTQSQILRYFNFMSQYFMMTLYFETGDFIRNSEREIINLNDAIIENKVIIDDSISLPDKPLEFKQSV